MHTSTVTVAVLIDEDRDDLFCKRESSDFRIEWFGGTTKAGGQHRNKHENSCRLVHVPTGIIKTAQSRSRESSYREARKALDLELDRGGTAHLAFEENSTRRKQMGAGARGDKRRTYRLLDDRVADHLTGKRARYSQVMNGDMCALWPA